MKRYGFNEFVDFYDLKGTSTENLAEYETFLNNIWNEIKNDIVRDGYFCSGWEYEKLAASGGIITDICDPLLQTYWLLNIFLIPKEDLNTHRNGLIDNGIEGHNILCFSDGKAGVAKWIQDWIIPNYNFGDRILDLGTRYTWWIDNNDMDLSRLYSLEDFIYRLGVADLVNMV